MTQDMIKTILSTTQMWKDDYTGKAVSEKFDPYVIRNHSGLTVNVTFGADQDEETSIFLRKSMEEVTKQTIPPETEFGFSQPQKQSSRVFQINVQIMNQTTSVNARKISRSVVETKDGRVCIIEVELFKGKRIITIRSGVKIVNRCPIDWKIGCMSLDSDSVQEIGTVKPNSSHGIPIDMIRTGTLVVQPVTAGDDSYHWSQPDGAFEFPSLMKRSGCIATCYNRKEKEAAKAFYAVVKSTFEDKVIRRDKNESPHLLQRFSCAIELKPPLALQNLFATTIQYSLYDKRVTTSSVAHMLLTSGTLEPGEILPIHSTNLKNNIYLSLRPKDGEWSETMAMIFSSDGKMDNIDQSIGIK
jgi:hypothetical protein